MGLGRWNTLRLRLPAVTSEGEAKARKSVADEGWTAGQSE